MPGPYLANKDVYTVYTWNKNGISVFAKKKSLILKSGTNDRGTTLVTAAIDRHSKPLTPAYAVVYFLFHHEAVSFENNVCFQSQTEKTASIPRCWGISTCRPSLKVLTGMYSFFSWLFS